MGLAYAQAVLAVSKEIRAKALLTGTFPTELFPGEPASHDKNILYYYRGWDPLPTEQHTGLSRWLAALENDDQGDWGCIIMWDNNSDMSCHCDYYGNYDDYGLEFVPTLEFPGKPSP